MTRTKKRNISPELATARARVAALSPKRPDDDPVLIEARRDLNAARLEDYIRRTVDAAPPLSPTQRSRLAALLNGGADS